ncbi:MAG: alpha/beta fold hydrolase [Aggregatilineales bacterium]
MRNLLIALMLLVLCVPIMAQEEEDTLYSTDQYQIPVPAGWQDNSTTEVVHFTNADGTANLYALSVEAEDVQSGITDALVQIDSDFSAQPVQMTDVPLPGGVVWTQNVYALPDGDLIAALGRVSDGWTYVIVLRAPQAGLAVEATTLNQVLLGHTIIGEVTVAVSLPDYINPDAFNESETVVVSGEYELPATLSMPVGDGPFPAVVIVHGSGPNDRDGTLGTNKPYRDIAQGLASQGIAVLRYDKRTFVYREPVAGFTIDDEVTNDALSAVQLLREMESVDPERIYVVGHSQGAMFAPRIAEQDGDLAGIVLLAGTPYAFDHVLSTQVNYLQSLDPQADVAGLDGLIVILDAIRNGADPVEAFGGDENQAIYWTSMMAYVPGDTASSLDLPMLVMQGERDYQATMTDFEAWQSQLGDRDNVTLISYPTLNHIFMALGDVDRMAIATDYSEGGFVDATVITDIVNWING